MDAKSTAIAGQQSLGPLCEWAPVAIEDSGLGKILQFQVTMPIKNPAVVDFKLCHGHCRTKAGKLSHFILQILGPRVTREAPVQRLCWVDVRRVTGGQVPATCCAQVQAHQGVSRPRRARRWAITSLFAVTSIR